MSFALGERSPDKSLAALEGVLRHLQECLAVEAFISVVPPILDPELALYQRSYVVAESAPAFADQ